jgi:glycosyltransferase involved in cell wall biosynthesis
MKISIAMATYNGERFLGQQLESIAAQSYLPYELVVQDDRSDDNTLTILESFASQAPFPMRIEVNDCRLGSTGNFDRAIARCQGTHIALCDQDDVWLPAKIERLSDRFLAQKELTLLFTNALRVDDTLHPMSLDLWQSLRLPHNFPDRVRSSRFGFALLRRPMVTGATMAFSARLRPIVQPIPQNFPDFIHDRWIATLAALCGPVEAIPDPLILYRQHADQQIGASELRSMTFHRRIASNYQSISLKKQVVECMRDRLAGQPAPNWGVIQKLIENQLHLEARLTLPRSRLQRVPIIAREWLSGRYARYSSGTPSAAKDFWF